jgi:BstXI restriction endonuclease
MQSLGTIKSLRIRTRCECRALVRSSRYVSAPHVHPPPWYGTDATHSPTRLPQRVAKRQSLHIREDLGRRRSNRDPGYPTFGLDTRIAKDENRQQTPSGGVICLTGTARLEQLPELIDRKLYKTGQTRGATVREIYQNRVSRSSTVLIPLAFWDLCKVPGGGSEGYENGYIVLVKPDWYFATLGADALLEAKGLALGTNALLIFQRRSEWSGSAPAAGSLLPNGQPFVPATNRTAPLGGTYIARVHSTTATSNGGAVVEGFNQTDSRGAGIRVYEYASSQALLDTRLQLECLIWLCQDSIDVMTTAGMSTEGAAMRRQHQLDLAGSRGLLDYDRLRAARMIDESQRTVCPLCQQRLSATAFMQRGEQAEGRETWDITITELGLFHIEELRVGVLQHRPYNLGWGHHYCNVVVKDAGILPTLDWMASVLKNNGR